MSFNLVLLADAGCAGAFPPMAYSATGIQAVVVDEQTGRPLEGVVVVARWVLRRMGGDGPSLHVAEAVTDSNGRFTVAAWGPKPRPPLMQLQDKSPLLILFKHGYEPLELRNQSKARFAALFPRYREMPTRDIKHHMIFEGMPDQAVQESFWDGLTIQLAPFRGTPDRWLSLLNSTVTFALEEDARQMPRFFGAMKAESQYLDRSTLDRRLAQDFDGFFSKLDFLLK
jgi:hypothetical protein